MLHILWWWLFSLVTCTSRLDPMCVTPTNDKHGNDITVCQGSVEPDTKETDANQTAGKILDGSKNWLSEDHY